MAILNNASKAFLALVLAVGLFPACAFADNASDESAETVSGQKNEEIVAVDNASIDEQAPEADSADAVSAEDVEAVVEEEAIDSSEDIELQTQPGAWKKDSTGWWYRYDDGSYPKDEIVEIDGAMYSFNKSGYMNASYWINIPSGHKSGLKAGWHFFGSSGAMATSTLVQGKYWVDAEGVMGAGGWIDGGKYYADANGVCLTGWFKEKGDWYYLNPAKTVSAWKKLGGVWYRFGSDGKMLLGWQEVDSVKYYFKDTGAMVTGWQTIAGNQYYFDDSGAKKEKCWVQGKYWVYDNGVKATNDWVDGDKYRVGADGVYLTGWFSDKVHWYYLDPARGGLKTVDKWSKISNVWYLFDADGKMLTGWQTKDGKDYYMDKSGAMKANTWVEDKYWVNASGEKVVSSWVDGDKYYVEADGVRKVGWITQSGKTYYLDPMKVCNAWKGISGSWYYFGKTGAMQTGWISSNGSWYYCDDTSGKMITGWYTEGNRKYYFDSHGVMATGTKVIDGKTYTFSSSGELIS